MIFILKSFSIKIVTLSKVNMLRYFKFEKVLKGDVIYDSSLYKEHCYNYYTSLWDADDILDQFYLMEYNQNSI